MGGELYNSWRGGEKDQSRITRGGVGTAEVAIVGGSGIM